ncbi:MAG: membrane lipoprotein lipid attachment site-containing protein [Bacteroidales bacterium]|nr:membrane lipoprotein lipid attachment site-containing protein [Candidatus Colicola coprequi]
MKKLLYFAAALLVLAGCSNKEEVNEPQNEPANYGTIIGQIDLPQGEDAKVGARKINAPEGW